MTRLLTMIAALGLLFLFLLLGVERSARGLLTRAEARRLVAEALTGGKSPERQTELFRRARKTDPSYPVPPCEQGVEFERSAQYAEAVASFHACLENDPEQAHAHLRYAESLLRARGSEALAEVQSALQSFLEKASQDAAGRREAEGLVLDLDELLDGQNATLARRYSKGEIQRILLRTPKRGASLYEGPRVPLRLGFRPGEAILGTAARAQLQEVAHALRNGSLAGSRILIEGHADNTEGQTRPARAEISRRRATVVKEFLARHCGIRAGRLSIAGFADRQPLRSNDTAEGRAANRRVELVNQTTQELVRRDVRNRFGS